MGGEGGRGVDGFDFPHRVHNHNRNVPNFHVLESSLQYNKCPNYRVCRPLMSF